MGNVSALKLIRTIAACLRIVKPRTHLASYPTCPPSCLQWRGLVRKDKEFYESKARRIAEEQTAKQEAAERAFNDSLNQYPVNQSPMSSPASAAGRMTPSGGNQQHMMAGQGRIAVKVFWRRYSRMI